MEFLNHLTIGQYIPTGSLIHKLEPRCKIFITFLAIVALFIADSIPSLGIWTLALIMLIHVSRVPFSFVIRGIKPILFLAVFTVLMHLFLTSGQIIFSWWIFEITKEGVLQGIMMGWRIILLVLFSNMLTLTTSPLEISDGIENILTPLKRFGVPSHEIAMMMTIALRFIPTLLDETDRILKAQVARGAELDSGGFIKKIKAFIPVLIPLFMSVFQRAEELATAMEARCYRGGIGRTKMKQSVWIKRDSIALVIFLLAAGGIIAFDIFIKR